MAGWQDQCRRALGDASLLAQQAAEAAAQHRLRYSDAVYPTVASRFGSVLVTRDREQHDRLAHVLTSYYPSDALTELAKP